MAYVLMKIVWLVEPCISECPVEAFLKVISIRIDPEYATEWVHAQMVCPTGAISLGM